MTVRLALAAAALAFLLAPANVALGQDRSAGHLEQQGDEFVPVSPDARQTAPPARPLRNGHVSVQVNVDGNGQNIVGDAANEPSLAVDPTDSNRMVIGWRQFDTISSDFRQAGWGYTADGGSTWTFPGVIEPGVFRSDPVLDADADGNFYYNSLTASGSRYWCSVYKSTDGGASWDAGAYAYGGDKQWQAIDRTDGIGRNNIYAYWTQYYSDCYPGFFTRSYDEGQSFESCIQIPGSPQWGTINIGPDGEVYVLGEGTGFLVAKSSTLQDQTQPPAWDFTRYVDLGGGLQYSGGPNPGGLLGQAWIATDHSTGPTRGNVYVLASVDTAGADPLDVMFSRSTDGGLTWSSPVRVNDDPGDSAFQWFGTMSVAPTGRIDVIWLDTRNDPGGYDSELYYSYSEDGGQTWSANEALSPPFDPHLGWPQQNKMGDYFDMISDADGAHLAYAATFNGEQDVYYLWITRLMSMSFPDGLPTLLTPGEATDIAVRISPGEEGYVPGSGTLHYRFDGGTFLTVPFVPLGGDLYQAMLPAAQCDSLPEFYFSAEGTQSGVIYQPPGAPAEVYAAVVGEYAVVQTQTLDTDPGWTTQDLWAFGQPLGGGGEYGGPDPTAGHTGQYVYGYNLSGDYQNNLSERHLTSTAFDCTGLNEVHLRFWRWLGVEQATYDHAYVRVSNNGTNWTTVWQNTGEVADSGWVQMDIDISAVADDQSTVYVRWTMGTTDGGWRYCGWNIDDIELVALTCEDEYAAGDLNCDGLLNGFDIDPFVLVLSTNEPYDEYYAQYPNCNHMLADINGDGQINGFDIDPFVDLLEG
ncbi:MAG: hypothetical protein KKB50_21535 [Planctomycetes bacterium]|nr:hypothetical protein [Planctomycetota bacterium]